MITNKIKIKKLKFILNDILCNIDNYPILNLGYRNYVINYKDYIITFTPFAISFYEEEDFIESLINYNRIKLITNSAVLAYLHSFSTSIDVCGIYEKISGDNIHSGGDDSHKINLGKEYYLDNINNFLSEIKINKRLEKIENLL